MQVSIDTQFALDNHDLNDFNCRVIESIYKLDNHYYETVIEGTRDDISRALEYYR